MLNRTLLAALCLASFARAGEPSMLPTVSRDWEIGQEGVFGGKGTIFVFQVVQILGENESIIKGTGHWTVQVNRGISSEFGKAYYVSEPRQGVLYPGFILKGVSTKGFADDKVIKLDSEYKIASTRQIAGSTYFVVTPVPQDVLDARAKAEKERLARAAETREAILREAEARRSADRKAADEEKAKLEKAAAIEKANRDAELREQDATTLLGIAKKLMAEDNERAVKQLRAIVRQFPATKAGIEAKKILDGK